MASKLENLFNTVLYFLVGMAILHYTILSEKISPKLMNVTYDKAKLLDENSSLLNQTGHLLESGYHTKPVKSFNKQSIGKTFLGIAE